MENPKQSSNARLAAIAALTAAFLILLVLVIASLAGEESGDGSAPNTRSRQGRTTDRQQQAQERKVYVVKPSDCCLSEIADKLGIDLEDLQELNPGLDPQAIHSGDRVKLR